MKLEMDIKNIKAIKSLTMKLPLEKGLYAITGENATGKSTIIIEWKKQRILDRYCHSLYKHKRATTS